MKIGILTGGGDTQALNAIIYGALQATQERENELIGFNYGWKGVLSPSEYVTVQDVNPRQGGTILRSSRTKLKGNLIDMAASNIDRLVDAFIAVGGDDTLTVGRELADRLSIPIALVTKTIDNDVGINAHTGEIDYEKITNYFTPGFPTAAEIAARFTSDLKTTAYSHERVMFLETMGRSPGWLALSSYKADPDFILVPEHALDFNDFAYKLAEKYKQQGYAVVVVAEGLRYDGSDKPISQDTTQIDPHGHTKLGGVSSILAARVKEELGIENSNATNPNYLYRSGSPNKLDLETGIKLGKLAASSVQNELSGHVAIVQRKGDQLVTTTKPIDKVLSTSGGVIIPRTLDLRFYDPTTYQITEAGKEYFRPIMGR